MSVEVSDRFTQKIDRMVAESRAAAARASAVKQEALERAERREWAHKKYGDERRWRE